jgi:murein DD-endopeptidase MepM/ murein hydrolase activator NlpD
MEAKQRLTFLIIPSSPHKRAFSLSVPFLAVPAFFFAFGMILLIASAGVWKSYCFHQLEREAHRLEMENRSAQAQIKHQESEIAQLTQEMLTIRERTAYIQDSLASAVEGSGSGARAQGGIEFTPQKVSKSPKPGSSGSPQHLSIPEAETASLSLKDLSQLDAELNQVVRALKRRQEKLDHTPSASPVDPRESWISSSYGVRISPFTGEEQFHPGVDIAGAEGTSIMAPAKGMVVFVGKEGSLGLTVRIKHDSVYETTYGHLRKTAVQKGQRVDRGNVIGYMGNTGRSTGPHLHYAIAKNGKIVNPLPYMADWRDGPPVLAAEQAPSARNRKPF